MTQVQLRKLKEQCKNEVIDFVLGLVYMTLHSKYKFNQDQLEEFKQEIDRVSDCVTNGTVSVSDIQKYMKRDLKFDSKLWEV